MPTQERLAPLSAQVSAHAWLLALPCLWLGAGAPLWADGWAARGAHAAAWAALLAALIAIGGGRLAARRPRLALGLCALTLPLAALAGSLTEGRRLEGLREERARWVAGELRVPLSGAPLPAEVEALTRRGGSWRVTLRVWREGGEGRTREPKLATRAQLTLNALPRGVSEGARVWLVGALSPLEPAADPLAFDAAAYAGRRGVLSRARGEVFLREEGGAWGRGWG
ncbi:MAG: DUF4131 domain-containing protein, partial [Deltaproteobacteria bacterium]|nr:DUF4131 domain-containing protein [Deltaproteobacteria bacterium]